MKTTLNLGDLANLAKYKTLLEKNLAKVSTILDPDAVAMGKDWAWADLRYTVDKLTEFLTK